MELAVDTGDFSARVSVAAVSVSRGFEAVSGARARAEVETEAPALSNTLGRRCWRGQRNDSQSGDEENEHAKHFAGDGWNCERVK